MSNNFYFDTRATNLRLDLSRLPFLTTTEEARDYLQKKMDFTAEESKNVPKVEVKLYSYEAGGNFAPFLASFPLDILKKDTIADMDEEESFIFNPKKEDNTKNMYVEYARIFASYTFNSTDVDKFSNPEWKRIFKINRRIVSLELQRFKEPGIYEIFGSKRVVLMLDPLRLLKDMNTSKTLTDDFDIEIDNWKKKGSGNFEYEYVRRIKKKDRKKNDPVDEITRNMFK